MKLKAWRTGMAKSMLRYRTRNTQKPGYPLPMRVAAKRAKVSTATWCRMERGETCTADAFIAVCRLLTPIRMRSIIQSLMRGGQ